MDDNVSSRRKLHEKVDELSDREVSVVEQFIDAVRTPVYIESLPETWLATPAWRETFAKLLQWHHALSERPLGTLQFEVAFNRACADTGWEVEPAKSAIQRFYDTIIRGDGLPEKRLSLKASSAKEVRPDIVHISKLTEAAWIQDARKGVDRRDSIVATFREYRSETSSIFILRSFTGEKTLSKLVGDEKFRFFYELIEIPTAIFNDVDNLTVRQAREGTISIPPDAAPRDRDFAIRIDGSDSKITLAGIRIEICVVHGRWGLR